MWRVKILEGRGGHQETNLAIVVGEPDWQPGVKWQQQRWGEAERMMGRRR